MRMNQSAECRVQSEEKEELGQAVEVHAPAAKLRQSRASECGKDNQGQAMYLNKEECKITMNKRREHEKQS